MNRVLKALWILPAALALALFTGALSAQAQDADTEAQSPSAETEQVPQDPDGDARDTSAEIDLPERSVDDYEASEQISEDLSVSFPVDI